jgi:hypothetical protein
VEVSFNFQGYIQYCTLKLQKPLTPCPFRNHNKIVRLRLIKKSSCREEEETAVDRPITSAVELEVIITVIAILVEMRRKWSIIGRPGKWL